MRNAVSAAVFALCCAALLLVPGPRRLADDGVRTVRAEVVETDDSGLQLLGLVEFGTQRLKVRLPDGRVFQAANELRAQLELDKKFSIGDTALVVLPPSAADGDILVESAESSGEEDGWKKYWLGETPETAADPDQTLIYLLVNEETDEVDAFRTSVNMIANGDEPVDVSLYLYRDSQSDRVEEEKNN